MSSSNLRQSQAVELGLALKLNVTDPEVIAALEQYDGEERERFALAALRVGVIALKQVSGSIDGEAVARAGEKLIGEVDGLLKIHASSVEKTLGNSLERYFDPKSGQLSQRLSRLVEDGGELTNLLDRHLHGEDSKLARTMAKQLGDESPLLARLDPNQKNSVIADIEKAVGELLDEQRKTVLSEFDLNKEDSAIKRMISQVTQINDSLKKEFDLKEGSSALSALKRMLDETKERIHKDLTLDDEASALFRLKREMGEQLGQIIEAQVKFQGEVEKTLERLTTAKRERAKSTTHGGDFEHELFETIVDLYAGSGDVVASVGDSVGRLANCKKGDILVTLGAESASPGANIVLEAKEDQSYDIRAAIEELEEARKNRAADVGVFIMSGRTAEDGRNAAHWSRPIQRVGNNVLAVWHPEREEGEAVLDAALSLARALVMRKEAEKNEVIDLHAVDEALVNIEKQLERFDDVQKQCDTIERAVEKIRKDLSVRASKLRKHVGVVEGQFSAMRTARQGDV